jgi:hypothetical protein
MVVESVLRDDQPLPVRYGGAAYALWMAQLPGSDDPSHLMGREICHAMIRAGEQLNAPQALIDWLRQELDVSMGENDELSAASLLVAWVKDGRRNHSLLGSRLLSPAEVSQ